VREYQLIQEGNTSFRILVEPLPGKTVDRVRTEKVMHEQLREYGLHQQLQIKVEAVERLTNDGERKFRRVVCKTREDKKESRRGAEVAETAKN
jgi:hypothetical protein